MAKKDTKDITTKKLTESQKLIEERIENIKNRIREISKQLTTMELIITELQEKINDSKYEDKVVTRSKLIRWYFEDIKIYNELNKIYSEYEQLLLKYNDQRISIEFKIKDLELKYQKLESDTGDMQMIFEKIEQKFKEISSDDMVKLPDIEVNFDDKLQI